MKSEVKVTATSKRLGNTALRCTSSTEIAIYTLINNILSSLNNRIIVGGLFCDLQKAFNCINYDILLSKMKFYGITGVALIG